MNSGPNSDSEQCTESKLSWVHQVHTQKTLAARAQRPSCAHGAVSWRALGCIVVVPGRVTPPSWHAQACVPAQAAMCLLRLLCACSGCCVPTQPSMCHNTAKPTVFLLSLLCATIQPSLLCAYSAFYVPQYS